ncbi:hypothetical protein B0H17DRAFT_1124671 [Mycena rosella]|uniref:Uncharacterized protein n=1 Tax=Mycena rosella TaxID=1033263 RepID=A0AAD7H021_MYCRO|nr:hypothetical protein B0H17DRAFT_1124671 [Mycena rosella]
MSLISPRSRSSPPMEHKAQFQTPLPFPLPVPQLVNVPKWFSLEFLATNIFEAISIILIHKHRHRALALSEVVATVEQTLSLSGIDSLPRQTLRAATREIFYTYVIESARNDSRTGDPGPSDDGGGPDAKACTSVIFASLCTVLIPTWVDEPRRCPPTLVGPHVPTSLTAVSCLQPPSAALATPTLLFKPDNWGFEAVAPAPGDAIHGLVFRLHTVPAMGTAIVLTGIERANLSRREVSEILDGTGRVTGRPSPGNGRLIGHHWSLFLQAEPHQIIYQWELGMVFIREINQENGKKWQRSRARGQLSPKKSGNELRVLGEPQSRPEKHQKKVEIETHEENYPRKRAVMNCEYSASISPDQRNTRKSRRLAGGDGPPNDGTHPPNDDKAPPPTAAMVLRSTIDFHAATTSVMSQSAKYKPLSPINGVATDPRGSSASELHHRAAFYVSNTVANGVTHTLQYHHRPQPPQDPLGHRIVIITFTVPPRVILGYDPSESGVIVPDEGQQEYAAYYEDFCAFVSRNWAQNLDSTQATQADLTDFVIAPICVVD